MQLWNSFNLNRLTNPRDCNCAGDNVVGCRGSASNREERSLTRDLTKLVLLFLCSSLFDPAGAHFDPVGALFDSGLLIYLISLLFDFLLLLLSLGFILCCLGAKVESVFFCFDDGARLLTLIVQPLFWWWVIGWWSWLVATWTEAIHFNILYMWICYSHQELDWFLWEQLLNLHLFAQSTSLWEVRLIVYGYF